MKSQDLESKEYKDLEQELLFSAIEENFQYTEEDEYNEDTEDDYEEDDEYEYEDDEEEDDDDDNLTLNKSPKDKKRKILKSGLKIKTILLLLVTLIVNTYAWFIFISTVELSMTMHVNDWDFELTSGNQSQDFEFLVEQVYPGMEEESLEITAKNNGETSAKLTCDIEKINILGTEYVLGASYTGEDGTTGTYTYEKLFEVLNSYPFKIEILINDQIYDGEPIPMATGAETKIIFRINWDYETGTTEEEIAAADIIDTYWGNEAYKYRQENPDKDSIKIDATIRAVQDNLKEENP